MNLALAVVLLPCIAGLMCLALRRLPIPCRVLSVAAFAAEAALAATLFARGAAPWSWDGIPLLSADGLSRLVCLGVAAFSLVTGIYSLGWFGPRGLASVVFALLVLERGVPEGQTLLTTVVLTVALSVLLHGLTSAPLVGAYHRWYESHAKVHPTAAEAAPATMPRRRRQLTTADAERLRKGEQPG